MNRRDKQNWLCRYRRCLDEIESLECLERELYLSLTEVSATVLDDLPRSSKLANNFDKGIVKHLTLQEELAELRKESDIIRGEITGAINKLSDSNQAQLMRYRYINGYSWDQIQTALNYSKSNVFRLHKLGLTNLAVD